MVTDKNLTRIRRQFAALERAIPPVRRIAEPLLNGGMRWARVPFALLLLAGGMLAFLPILGVWMIPLGLLLLAIDIPLLRPVVAAGSIRARRRIGRVVRRRRGTGAHH
jgi:hypothetical protein